MDKKDVRVDPQFRMVLDEIGDPYIWMNVVLPEGTCLSADEVDALALKMLEISANTRVRAQAVRKQMLAGIPAREAVDIVTSLLDTGE